MSDSLQRRKREGKELVGFKNELDNLFDRFFGLDFPISRKFLGRGDWDPRVDMIEGKDTLTIKAEIPGCNPKDIDVRLDDRMLTIKGEKKQEKEEKEDNFHRVERSYGSFIRNINLPADVDQKNIDASYKKGVLKLVFKKTAEMEGKKIEIKTS